MPLRTGQDTLVNLVSRFPEAVVPFSATVGSLPEMLLIRGAGVIHTGCNDASNTNKWSHSQVASWVAWYRQYCCFNGIFVSHFALFLVSCLVWVGSQVSYPSLLLEGSWRQLEGSEFNGGFPHNVSLFCPFEHNQQCHLLGKLSKLEASTRTTGAANETQVLSHVFCNGFYFLTDGFSEALWDTSWF